jgi:hypothetical protein
MKRTLFLKPLDFAALTLSAALTILAAFMVYGRPQDTAQVIIRSQSGSWVFPLDAEETLTVSGPIGDTVVEIRGGRSRILASPCNGQTCVAAGHIYRQGQWAACLPNTVFLYIEGTGDESTLLDSTTW